MKVQIQGTTLVLSELPELSAATATEFKSQTREAFTPLLRDLDVNLAGVRFLDSSGLGALISACRLATERGGRFRLIAPTPPVLQILELTRMHRIFEIVPA